MVDSTRRFLSEVTTRLERLTDLADAGGLDAAVDLIARSLTAGGIVQAFGTGHSQAFAMEIAGRAGGLIPTNSIALRDVVYFGGRDVSVLADGASLEREPGIVDELWQTIQPHPEDVFVIASNSGVNGSIVGIALAAKEHGHGVIAVTSLEHTARVTPKHPSGSRLSEVADVVIDNLAPYGDTTLTLDGGAGSRVGVGAVSSMTAAFIAQLLTLGVAERITAAGDVPPVYLSSNIPAGDEHNNRLENTYGDRLRRHA
ncbi:MAG: SIS domain-containing protein [Nocardioides sp.]